MHSGPRIPRDSAAQPAPAANRKALLRQSLLQARSALPAATRAGWDQAIGHHLLAWRNETGVDALAVYWPLPGEPDLRAAYAALAAAGVRLTLPVVIEKDAPLVFADWRPGEDMLLDRMKIAVPAERRLVACPAAIVLPCLGFNKQRLRLGYGGGFYDRTLAQAPRPATLGVAYCAQRVDFDGGPYDIALDRIATENGFIE